MKIKGNIYKYQNSGENRFLSNSGIYKIRSITKNPKLVNNRRNRLVESSVKLFVSRGFDKVTINDIADFAHISKGTIYNYIGNKEDLVFLILEYISNDFRNKVKKNLKKHKDVKWADVLRDYIKAHLEMVDKMQDALNFINHVVARLDPDRRKLVLAALAERYIIFESILDKGNKAGEFQVDDVKLMSHNIVRLLAAWANNRWYLRKFIQFDEYLKKQTEFIFNGLGIINAPDQIEPLKIVNAGKK